MRVYLDYQSTCPLLPAVRESMLPYFSEEYGNPSSLHQAGLFAREALGRAREQLAAFINAESPENIIFTGTGTEAVNLAIKGAAAASRGGKHIVLSSAEQPAVARSIEYLEQNGITHTKVDVDLQGRIPIGALEKAITPETFLVCLHHGNPDIGTIQDAAKIGEITSALGILLFLDATSSAGWALLDVQHLRANLVALAPHRFYGPKGVGILYRHRRARIAPLVHGGEQEGGRHAGTENVAAAVGAGKAAEIATDLISQRVEHTGQIQQLFLRELLRRVPHVKLNGPEPGPERLPNSLNLSFEFVEGEGLALMLDAKGIAVSSGAACVTKSMRVPPVLAAIGLPESLARGSVIISFGEETTEPEVSFAVETIATSVAKLREMSPLWDDFQQGRISSEIRVG